MASIPLIQPSTDVGGLPPAPRLDPQEFAYTSTFGLRTLAGAAGQISDELDRAVRAEHIAKDELAKLELGRAKLEMQRQYAEGVDQLKNDPTVTTEDYVQRVNQLGDKVTEGVSKTLRDPRRTFDKFQLVSQQERISQEIEARTYNRHRLIQNVVSETSLRGQQLKQQAVHGATPEDQEQAVETWNNIVTNLVDRGFIGGGAGATMKAEFQKDVTRGRVEKQFLEGDAVNKNYVIGALRAGDKFPLDPDEQQKIANQLEQREETANSRLNAEREAERKARAEEADKTLTDLTAAGKLTEARGALAAARRDMTDERYHQWHERLKKGVVTITDPEVKQQMIGEVYNAQNNPLEVDRLLRSYWAAGKVAEDDMKPWASHLESRINRLQTRAIAAEAHRDAATAREEARIHREKGDVEQQIRAITTVTGPGATALHGPAQDAYNWAIEDMHRNMPGYGGNERPMQWLNRNRAVLYGRLKGPAQARLRAIDADFDFKSVPGTTGETQASVDVALRTLKANQSRMRADRYDDQLRRLKEKASIIEQLEKWAPPTDPLSASPPATRQRSSGAPMSEPAIMRGR